MRQSARCTPARSTWPCRPWPSTTASSRAHLVVAWMNLLLDWNLDAAMREVRRAIELSPSDTDAHSFHSTLLCFVGRSAEAMKEVQYMLKLNPASLLPNQYAAWMFLHLGQHARAEAQAKRTIERFPDSLQPYFVLGWSAWYQGRAADAVAALETALSHSREALSVSYLGHVYGRLGRTRRGPATAPRARATSRTGAGSPDRIRGHPRGTWRDRRGVRVARGGVPAPGWLLFWLVGAPGLDPLHSDARFADMVRRVGVVPSEADRRRSPRRAGRRKHLGA